MAKETKIRPLGARVLVEPKEVKEEITVELIEAMVPIPVTVKGDSVRLIEKEK